MREEVLRKKNSKCLLTGVGSSQRADVSLCHKQESAGCQLELHTKVREYFTITEKTPTRAFSWLKVPTSGFTLKQAPKHGK